MDEERGRFLLSLRPSHLRLVHRLSGEEEEVRKTLATRLQGYLEERDAVLEAMATATGGEENCICLNDTESTVVESYLAWGCWGQRCLNK